MRVPSRFVLSAAVACGAALGSATPGLAAEGGVLDTADDAACDLTNGGVSTIVGVCETDPSPSNDSNRNEQTTRPTGNQGAQEATDSSQQSADTDSDVVTADDSDADDDSPAPNSTSGGSDSGPVDRDNGDAPQGGIEAGGGGTADGSDALPATLAGGVIVAAGGMVFAQRRHGRHARQSRHSL